MEKSAAIELKNIGVSYDGEFLFQGLDLTIEHGACTCILGPSGSGKSTLLRLISGDPAIEKSGEIVFGSSSQQAVSWMSQEDLLLPWFNVLDNVLLGPTLRGQKDPSLVEMAKELIAEAGLEGYEEYLPAKLSGGMRQRVALLRTLIEQRPVILMDEPFSSLDALTRLKLQNLSSEMTKGRTVLLVTHDPMEAIRMADTILVFSGRPVAVTKFKDCGGNPPRDPSDPMTMRTYGRLVEQLMQEKSI